MSDDQAPIDTYACIHSGLLKMVGDRTEREMLEELAGVDRRIKEINEALNRTTAELETALLGRRALESLIRFSREARKP
jgi:hypothetical protein